jgi:hypothetical protein
MLIRGLTLLGRSLVGLWLGLWTIAGVATCASGLLILALQLYGYFYLGFWADLTPAGVLQGFNIAYPVVPWQLLQEGIDCLICLPLAGVFIWCGFQIAAMAWIARKNLERKVLEIRVMVPTTAEKFASLGISSLEVRPEQ